MKKKLKNYILVIDNAKYDLNKEIVEYAKMEKMKILTNCPYYSKFNGVKFVFRSIKMKIYKTLFKSKKYLKKKIINILENANLKAQ